MAKQKQGGKGSRKIGRNKVKCSRYRMECRLEKNKDRTKRRVQKEAEKKAKRKTE